MDTLVDEKDIEDILNGKTDDRISLQGDIMPNGEALIAVKQYLDSRSREKISLRSLKDNFTKVPFGFLGTDVAWLVARLFKDGEVALTLSSAPVTTQNTPVPLMISYLTKRQYEDKLLSEKRKRASENDLKRAWSVLATLWPNADAKGDEDHFFDIFQKLVKSRLETMRRLMEVQYDRQKYPGKRTVQDGIRWFERLQNIQRSQELVEAVRRQEDELKDFADDYEPIQEFFNSKGNSKGKQ